MYIYCRTILSFSQWRSLWLPETTIRTLITISSERDVEKAHPAASKHTILLHLQTMIKKPQHLEWFNKCYFQAWERTELLTFYQKKKKKRHIHGYLGKNQPNKKGLQGPEVPISSHPAPRCLTGRVARALRCCGNALPLPISDTIFCIPSSQLLILQFNTSGATQS